MLTRNKNYWLRGKPYLDGITVTILPDAQALITQLESGARDVVMSPAWGDVARLKADPKYQALTNPLTGGWYLNGANRVIPPTHNKKLRQALNFAMDRNRFAMHEAFDWIGVWLDA